MCSYFCPQIMMWYGSYGFLCECKKDEIQIHLMFIYQSQFLNATENLLNM